jgi:hypothetical protein
VRGSGRRLIRRAGTPATRSPRQARISPGLVCRQRFASLAVVDRPDGIDDSPAVRDDPLTERSDRNEKSSSNAAPPKNPPVQTKKRSRKRSRAGSFNYRGGSCANNPATGAISPHAALGSGQGKSTTPTRAVNQRHMSHSPDVQFTRQRTGPRGPGRRVERDEAVRNSLVQYRFVPRSRPCERGVGVSHPVSESLVLAIDGLSERQIRRCYQRAAVRPWQGAVFPADHSPHAPGHGAGVATPGLPM